MKNLYEIKDWKGQHLCYQVAATEQEAIETAKIYGFKKAAIAVFIRTN